MNKKTNYFETLKLYQHFIEVAGPEQISLVNKHIEYCIPLLDHYYKAFPTFTLHNVKHQQNIVRIMGDLLGDRLKEVSPLEAALLLLSAIYHDLGMVFSESELANIENEEDFEKFLNGSYKAKLQYQENNSRLDKDLAEWYCRWSHARRVWIYLRDFEKLKWGNFALNTSLGNICESHNEEASKLNDDLKFEIDFLEQADLRFVAVLLRLSDILDFDESRSPMSVYEYLELDNPRNSNEEISRNEWEKHLCSIGFSIFNVDNNISLNFKAAPNHPRIEKNIQTFLNIIESELKNCTLVINKCSEKWRNIKLPLTIDRSNIKSQNYKKGDYRLTLDEHQIINLLTGENLYDTEFIFIRELLQNAIDTSRMREYHELSCGNSNFKIKPIEIKSWIDSNGYRWVRVEDNGMGINEYVIENHLLRKGSSYYVSDYFKIQKRFIKEKTGKDFTPISRFGIGLLSCFILGDVVEISTRAIPISQTNSNDEKLRLSIKGLRGQYYLQADKDKHVPLDMPNPVEWEKGFRKEHGTSIAIRISRNKDSLNFEESLMTMINYCVTCSPVEIYYNNKRIGVDFNDTLNTTLAKRQFFPFSEEEISGIKEVTGSNIEEEVGIDVIPIDISGFTENKNLRGQVVFLRLRGKEFEKTESSRGWEYDFSVTNVKDKYIRFHKHYRDSITFKEVSKEYIIKLDTLFENIFDTDRFDEIFLQQLLSGRYYRTKLRIIHNGINVPNSGYGYSYHSDAKLDFFKNIFTKDFSEWRHRNSHACFGIIYLQDNLIPDLSIARNTIKGFNFSIYSSLFYAARELNNELVNGSCRYNFFANIDEYFTLKDVKSDDLVCSGVWELEKIVLSNKGFLSIEELKKKFNNQEIKIYFQEGHSFITVLSRGMIELFFNVEYVIDETATSFFIIRSLKSDVSSRFENLDYYPLLFVPFNNDTILSHNGFINLNHTLGKWIYANKNIIAHEFEIYFKSLIRHITEKNIDAINSAIDYFKKVLNNALKPNTKLISKSDFHSVKMLF